MSMILALQKYAGDLSSQHVYELSSRGPIALYLAKRAKSLTLSEYFDDGQSGEIREGVLHQDVQALTFDDSSFDVCTSTEVFEHVPDDGKGFAEILRVLKSDGSLIFTVPLNLNGNTLQRAVIRENELVHLEAPEYHDDVIRGKGKVLAYRTYGVDIVDQLKTIGFKDAFIDLSFKDALFGHGRPVVVAFVEDTLKEDNQALEAQMRFGKQHLISEGKNLQHR